MSSLPPIEESIKSAARELGFDLCGITDAVPSVFSGEYQDWIANGHAGEMSYLTSNLDRRLDPSQLLPDARSIIVVAMNYYTRNPEPGDNVADRAIFARYARGDDYHDVMLARLNSLLDVLKQLAGPAAEGKAYVDTGPILEREVARRAGLGWFGKNTMLINTRRGTYFFLGEIITNVSLTPDSPAVGGCGTCTRCLDACPTNAFVAPFVLDSRRCISYLTIELKGPIPEEFHTTIAETGRIYGCDICQECCPFNRDRGAGGWGLGVGEDGGAGGWGLGVGEIHGASATVEPAFQAREITVNSTLEDILLLTEEEFRVAFKGSAVKRAKHTGLIRNAAVALAGRDDVEAIAALNHALNDTELLIRDQAEWSLKGTENRRSGT